jgi:hypothetical protein
MSQRSAEDARLGDRFLLSHLALLPRLDVDDDDDVLLLPHFLFTSQRSTEDARPGLELPQDDAGLPGFLSLLCASHLSAESARPGLGALEAKEDGRMMKQGAIKLIGGGVGSRPGRSAAAALAIARSTDDMADLLLGPRKHKRAGKREMRLCGNEANRRSDGLWD